MSKSSEYKTRREKIDVLLKKTGWDVTDRTKVVQEVDTKPFNPTIVQLDLLPVRAWSSPAEIRRVL